jgi:predicted Rossmann fold nucleotide-binding protein DprA/Smf involved in DNA uptake
VLFVRGNVAVRELPAIPIVGEREASDAGRARARKLGWSQFNDEGSGTHVGFRGLTF